MAEAKTTEQTVRERESASKADLLTGKNLKDNLPARNAVLTGACPNCGYKAPIYGQVARYKRPDDGEIVELPADPDARTKYEAKGFTILDGDVTGEHARMVNSAVIEEFPRHDPREPLRHTPDDPPSPALVAQIKQIAPERVAEPQDLTAFAKNPPEDSLAADREPSHPREVKADTKGAGDRSNESEPDGSKRDTAKVETRKAEANTTTARGGR